MGEPTPYAADDLLDLLRAVREALDVPHAASRGGEEIRDKVLQQRLLCVGYVLGSVLNDDVILPAMARFLRMQTAEHPATGYVTHEQAQAAVKAGKSWSEAVALPADTTQPSGSSA